MSEVTDPWHVDEHYDAFRSSANSDQSVEQVKTSVSHFLNWLFEDEGVKALSDIDAKVMMHYYQHITNTYVDRTAHNRWTHIKYYLKTVAIERDWETENGFWNPARRAEEKFEQRVVPEDLVNAPEKVKQADEGVEVLELDPSEIDDIVEACDTIRDKLIIRLLQDTGLRAGELVEVREDDVDLENRAIERVKTEKRDDHYRTVWYSGRTSVLMREYLEGGGRSRYPPAEDSDYLLVSLRSEQIHKNWLNTLVVKRAKEAGVQDVLYTDAKGHDRYRITCHTFRHNFAIKRIRSDVGGGSMPIEHLRRLLGHRDYDSVRWYLKNFGDSELKQAYERYSP